jgi:hypothetical protein
VTTCNEIRDMIDLITTSIVIQQREVDLYFRSALESTADGAKRLFTEIADKFQRQIDFLESKKKLLEEENKRLLAKERKSGL